jgi:hypothetical protein
LALKGRMTSMAGVGPKVYLRPARKPGVELSAYHTSLAAECYVLPMCCHCGANASLILGNHTGGGDRCRPDTWQTASIDVKGVAGLHDCPCDTLTCPASVPHGIVLVSFDGTMASRQTVPSLWGVPANEITAFPSVCCSDRYRAIHDSAPREAGLAGMSRMMEGLVAICVSAS